jgi:hypothetical protein
MAITGTQSIYAPDAGHLNTYAIQSALGAYTDEAYTTAKKLSGTGIVGPNPNINTDTETFIGQVRWYKPINPTINIASLTDSSNGTGTNYTSDFATYVKTVRTHGATQVNMQQVITQQDGLAKISRDFGETRAQDEHNAILAVLKGVAISEALVGTAAGSGTTGTGGQTFTSDPADATKGFYVDLATALPVIAASAAVQGADRASGFLNAIGAAWKDYEPEYAYLVTSPEVYASLRSANLVDDLKVTEANVSFDTIFGGKFRLIQTRATQRFTDAQFTKLALGAGLDINSGTAATKMSFIVLPGSIAMEALNVPTPVEVYRDARAFKGGGSTDIWYRWGFVAHPGGYDWAGLTNVFPDDAAYQQVIENSGSPIALTSVASGTLALTKGVWTRKTATALSLGILPLFHS